jgi:hypothetical protein
MTTLRCTFRAPRKPKPERKPVAPLPSPAARMLALAHHVEHLVEDGELDSYADAARALGLTRARLTQIMKLLLLAPEVQERVMTGELRATERALRGVVGESNWQKQLAASPPTSKDSAT